MKKEKTFNQEVEHFCRVLEAEISKKECWAVMKSKDWNRSVENWLCFVPRRTGCRRNIVSSMLRPDRTIRRCGVRISGFIDLSFIFYCHSERSEESLIHPR
jgi:hypothetical protein